MCAHFLWPACPDGTVSVPPVRASAVNGRVVPGVPRYDIRFIDGQLSTAAEAEVRAVRQAMKTARGEIREIAAAAPVKEPEEALPQVLEAALQRTLRAIWRDEELDLL